MSERCCKKLDRVEMTSQFLDSFDFVLTDCDGVLWAGDEALPGSSETIQALIKLGKKVIYVTNNSTKSRTEYVKKCERLGFPAEVDSIISTSFCAALHLKNLGFKKKVYVVGSRGVTDELEAFGIGFLPIGPDPLPGTWAEYVKTLPLDPEVGAVIVGFDEHISYPKLIKAANYLKDQNCVFIATNTDEQFPAAPNSNLVIPGTGTLVAAVETVSGRTETKVVVGKPSKSMFNCIQTKFPEISPKRCLMIGDRLNTDILLGTRNGMQTLLVLTGINSLDDVKTYEQSKNEEEKLLVPDFYMDCLGDWGKLIKNLEESN